LKYFKRILAETANELIKQSDSFFERFEKPEVAKIDNHFALASSSPHPRTISKVAIHFLKKKIVPLFTAPRKPWNQASIEGANSVFSRKFWKRFDFKDLKEVDQRLEDFNKSYQWYLGYQPPEKKSENKDFAPRIYFIRKVYQDQKTQKGYIEIANENILLPKSYINFFTLSEWNLKEEKLYVYFENEKELR
jgi:lipopolysaccharide biosynthesis glycosyltransferase